MKTALSKQQYALASDIWKYLSEKGVSPRNAAAIMGNIMQESSFKRNARQKGGDRALGLFSMHGQDLKHYTEIMEFLKTLNARGITILMITHDMHLMLEYTTRALVITNGELVADDTTWHVLTNDALIKTAHLKRTS